MGARPGRWLARQVPTLLLVGVLGGFIYSETRRERAAREQQLAAERAEQAERAAIFAHGKLGEVLALCSKGWANLEISDEPVALAWTRQGLNAYFHQGADASTLRLVRCDASGAVRGPRVSHPLREQLPAEAPTESEQERTSSDFARAVAEASAQPLEPSQAAVELLRHPVTGRVLARRWRAGPEGASATVEPEDAPPFASLLPAGEVQPLPGFAPPVAAPLRRWRWTVDTESAFALLQKQLPKGARIAQLRFEEDEIEVTIEHPTKAFDGDPDAPYGDQTFDEYGVAHSSWWYPRPEPSGFGCVAGAELQHVHAQFLAARSGHGRLAWAWYSCSTAYSDGHRGAWHLVPAS